MPSAAGGGVESPPIARVPPAASVGANLAASVLGNLWTALVQIAFVPVYIALLGLEAYGLIALHAVLQMSLWLLDMGFTPSVSREVARAKAGARDVEGVRRLLRSMELAFAAPAALIVIAAVGEIGRAHV